VADHESNYIDLNNVSKKFKNLYSLGSTVLEITSFSLLYFALVLSIHDKMPVFYSLILIFTGLLIAMVLSNIYTDYVVNSCIPINVNGNTVYVMDGVTRIKNKYYNLYNAAATITLKPKIIITNSLVNLLNKDELNAVISHEAGHIKLHQTYIYIFTSIMFGLTLQFVYLYFDFFYTGSYILRLLFYLFIFVLLVIILRKTLLRSMEMQADWFVNDDLKPALKSALIKMHDAQINESNKFRKGNKNNKKIKIRSYLFDSHPPFYKRPCDYNPSSIKNISMIFFPFSLMISGDFSMYLYSIIHTDISIAFYLTLIAFIGILIGLTILLPVVYYIIKNAGFPFDISVLSIISYISIASIEIIYTGLFTDLIINIFATTISILFLSMEGKKLKAFLIYLSIFIITSTFLVLISIIRF